MNPDAYLLLFDLADARPPNTGWLAASAVALAIAAALWWQRRRRQQAVTAPRFFACAAAVVLAVTTASVWDHHRLLNALQRGQALVVEGPLQSYGVQHRAHYNASSKRYDRSIAESFYVGPVPFGFVRDASVAGYTNSGAPPLAVADGDWLRVHYVEDTPGDFVSRRIVRLERRPTPRASVPDAGLTTAHRLTR